MQSSPVSVTIGGTPAIIGSGKVGVVYAINAGTGVLIICQVSTPSTAKHQARSLDGRPRAVPCWRGPMPNRRGFSG
jgi:hypothetical protein